MAQFSRLKALLGDNQPDVAPDAFADVPVPAPQNSDDLNDPRKALAQLIAQRQMQQRLAAAGPTIVTKDNGFGKIIYKP